MTLEEKELLAREIAEGRWDVQNEPGKAVGAETIFVLHDPVRQQEMNNLNIGYRVGSVGKARREGKDLH